MRTFTKVLIVGCAALLLCTSVVGDLPALLYPQVVRVHKTSQLQAVIYIADGDGGMVTRPMSRRLAEAELRDLYADADATLLVEVTKDGHRGYAAPDTGRSLSELYLANVKEK